MGRDMHISNFMSRLWEWNVVTVPEILDHNTALVAGLLEEG
jgi:hypothetical protein